MTDNQFSSPMTKAVAAILAYGSELPDEARPYFVEMIFPEDARQHLIVEACIIALGGPFDVPMLRYVRPWLDATVSGDEQMLAAMEQKFELAGVAPQILSAIDAAGSVSALIGMAFAMAPEITH